MENENLGKSKGKKGKTGSFTDSRDGKTYKTIGFLFDNICKLDLSNLSFEDVSFNNDSYVDLSNTNAKIEFDKSYEFKKNNEVIVKNTSFKNVDLSNNNFEYLTTNKKAILLIVIYLILK